MKVTTLVFIISLINSSISSQLVSVDSLNLGVIYKPDEAVLRKIYVKNIGSEVARINFITSTDYHQVFYYHGQKINGNIDTFNILPFSTDSFEFNMKDLSWKLKKHYKFDIRFSYYYNDKYQNLNIPTKLEMGRKLSFSSKTINLGTIDASKPVKKSFYITNLSKDKLRFNITNHVINNKIILKPHEKKLIPIDFNYYNGTKAEIDKSKNNNYNYESPHLYH